jgi:hypothetical protein
MSGIWRGVRMGRAGRACFEASEMLRGGEDVRLRFAGAQAAAGP